MLLGVFAVLLFSSIGYAHPFSPLLQAPLTRQSPQPSLFTRLRNALISFTPGQLSIHAATSRFPERFVYSHSQPPSALRERYDGDIVLRFNISTKEEAAALAEATDTLFLDVWDYSPEWADIRMAKDVVPSLLGLLPTSMQHAHTPLMHDLAQTVYESLPSPALADPGYQLQSPHRSYSPSLSKDPQERNIFFSDYQPLSVIVPWLRLMASLFPTHVRLVNIGTSFEGRDILALRIGVHAQNSEKPAEPRKTIVVSGGSHAREWISIATVNFAAYSMITSYGKGREMTKLMEEFDWVFIPTLNPDGYVYTWETDRLWRKNAQQTSLRFCKGLDIDRSFDFEWDGDRTKGNPCSESFAGDVPFQAVEALHFADWVKNETKANEVEFVGYLDLHSYSQQILYPYSYSCINTPPTLENLEEVGLGLSKAIHQVDGESYGVTSACEGSVANDQESRNRQILWPRIESSGGTALDWMYHEIGVKYSYQIKLRDTGTYGFLLPRSGILPTGREVFGALKFFGNYLLSNRGVEAMEPSPSSLDRNLKISKPNDMLHDIDGAAANSDRVGTSWDLKR